ncbi:hypothetical protein FQR65_LT12034 [Abscondita terminalis]|nr:hypothetical protein FQR65_LT12034 [Abscondita terminalis]
MVFSLTLRKFRHRPTLNLTYIHSSIRFQCDTKIPKFENLKENEEYPQVPNNCCMSNCPNCVWIDYAQKLSDYYKDGGEKALKEIEEHITDVSLKAYILMEIRIRKKFG